MHKKNYQTDGILEIKDFLLDSEVALLFELEFLISVQGQSPKPYLLGFEKILPRRNSIGELEEQDYDFKLIKGPAESYFDDLIVSEDQNKTYDGRLFEFTMKSFISMHNKPPSHIKRI